MDRIIFLILNILLRSGILVIEEFRLDIDPVTPIYWINNKEIFVNEENQSFIYDVNDRKIKNSYQKTKNEIYGYDHGEVYICTVEIKDRNSTEEYSTHLRRINLDSDILLDIELKPTLEVLECREDTILKTIFPIEKKFYIFSDNLYELDEYKENFFSPNLKYFIDTNDLGNYVIKSFSIRFGGILTLE
jgi:hypothetical protein